MAHNDGNIYKGGGDTCRIKGFYQEKEAFAKNNMLKLPNSIIYNQLCEKCTLFKLTNQKI